MIALNQKEATGRMSRNVYVGNLPYRITDEEVRDVFTRDGREVVSVNLIIDRETGRPRGFGFVEMKDEAQAEAAVQAMDGFMLDGRPLKVNIARPREGGGAGPGGPRRPRPEGAPPSVYRTGGPPREGGGGYGGGGGGGYGGG
ncbi:MAG: RNA recognition motif domain-containing protein, partial [Myxococcota bacterium]